MLKQTQTKFYDFSDTGLDFSAGSKALFPDRFKKILAQGFNPQIASSAVIIGDQVMLSYSVTHGYKEDRVMQVTAAGGFNKEVYIDRVTSTTVIFTEVNTTGLTGAITTKTASMGWELVYEVANIQIYKMLHIDDTVRYVRLCHQDIMNYRQRIAVCIGKTYDPTTGFITDTNALQSTKDVMTPNAPYRPSWDGYEATATYNTYTYSQGFANFGKASIIGSKYHFILFACFGSELYDTWAILPKATLTYASLDYPLIICRGSERPIGASNDNAYGAFYNSNAYGLVYIGNIRCRFNKAKGLQNENIISDSSLVATQSVLPIELDNFNTTTCQHLQIFEYSSSQFLGVVLGMYQAIYSNSSIAPNINNTNLPLITSDIDLDARIIIGESGNGADKSLAFYLAAPVEEIKIA